MEVFELYFTRVPIDRLGRFNVGALPRGEPPGIGAVFFDGVRVEVVRAVRSSGSSGRGGCRRLFVCPRCGQRVWHIYYADPACRRCLDLRYACRHYPTHEPRDGRWQRSRI